MTVPHDWHHAKKISFAEVRQALERADLRGQRTLLAFIQSRFQRIRPKIEADWLFDQRLRYLLGCISNASSPTLEPDAPDEVDTPFEAAHDLVRWFEWYVRVTGEDDELILPIVARIAQYYREHDHHVRNGIETGFLEHALELPRNRRFFADWSRDPDLAEGYNAALSWGLAHSRDDSTKP